MAFWEFITRLFRREAAPTPPTAPSPAAPPAPAVAPAPAPAPAPPPAGLQPGDFLPINRDDLLKQGEEVRRTTGWMWFGRRDIIPPVSDPRTKLIDRGMLTQGLVSAEELAEMHRVGDEWSKHANRLEHIQVQAGQAAGR